MPEEIIQSTPVEPVLQPASTEPIQQKPVIHDVQLDAPKKQQSTFLKIFGFLLLLLVSFGVSFGGGYYIAQKTQKNSVVERPDPSQKFAERFEKKLDKNNVTTFEFFTDGNNNKKKDPGEAVSGILIEIRKKENENPFQYATTNQEGVIELYGLPIGEYEARYSYNSPDQWRSQDNITNFRQYQMSINGKVELLSTPWLPLSIRSEKEEFTMPLSLYKPSIILVENQKASIQIIDPAKDRILTTAYTSDNYNLESRAIFQKDKDIYFMNRNTFISLHFPSQYSTFHFYNIPDSSNLNADVTSASPDMNTIMYPSSIGNGFIAKYASSVDTCGKEGVVSIDSEAVQVNVITNIRMNTFSFADDTYVAFFGRKPSEPITRLIIAECANGEMKSKKTNIRMIGDPVQFFALDNDTILLSGSFLAEPPSDSTASAQQMYGAYLYHPSTMQLVKPEGNFPEGELSLSQDRQWLIAPYDGGSQVTFVRTADLLQGKVHRVSDSAETFFGSDNTNIKTTGNTVVSQFGKPCKDNRTCLEVRVGKIQSNRIVHEKAYTLENMWSVGRLAGVVENAYEE